VPFRPFRPFRADNTGGVDGQAKWASVETKRKACTLVGDTVVV